ncbi:MAG: EF-hand domain-containing protein [Planctomycetes bacterium]|nr:EF-hand domain-containing protein [Planctomycetota bacterium]MCW8134319.1 EF-hand domain-containing protein [Planctomycetota bacterium]
MIRAWMWLMTAVLFCGAAGAQGMGGVDDEINEEVDEVFETLDENEDGKITLKELKAFMVAAAKEEEDPDSAYLAYVQLFLFDFLSADTNDNLEVTKAELRKFYKQRYTESDFKQKLSAKDMKVLEKEYLQPYVDRIYTAVDADKDGSLSRKEIEAADDGSPVDDDDWKSIDTDKNNKISKPEMIAYLKRELAKQYDIEKEEAAEVPGEQPEPKPEVEKPVERPVEKPVERPVEKPTEKPANDPLANYDEWGVYRKAGRSWMLKVEVDFGFKNVSYTKTEVLESGEDSAKVRETTLNDKKEAIKGSPARERTVKFKKSDRGEKSPTVTDETIKVEAGEFDCYKVTVETAGGKTTTWTSKKHPGLVVKFETEARGGKTTGELVEFKE